MTTDADDAKEEQRRRWRKAYRQGLISQAEWDTVENCDLVLGIGQNDAHIFSLLITFFNRGTQAIECSFSLEHPKNQQSAAWLWLSVLDEQGQHILGKTGIHFGRSYDFDRPVNMIEPGGGFTFELTATASDGLYQFPYVTYSLVRGRIYTLQFRYAELLSNTVAWTIP